MAKERWEQAVHDPGDLRREMQEGHGRRLVNMLVGLIINANDAYERSGQPKKKKIRVEVDRTVIKRVRERTGRARIRIVDWAQGMDYDDFGKDFSAYGGAKSLWAPGSSISGLFGREASDIMWSNVGSRYMSIKNGKGYACEFRPPVEFRRYELDRRATKTFRQEYSVGHGNFTLAEFHLDQDYPLPPYEHLVNGLMKHFRLRLINTDASTEVWLYYRDSKGTRKPERIAFTRLEDEGSGADLLQKDVFELHYKNYPPFRAQANLFRKRERDLSQSISPEREGGILVYADDQTIMELSLFTFDEAVYTPYTRRLFGYLKLDVAEILRQELRGAEQRLALIETDRSQLRRHTEFYETLKGSVEAWLKPWVDAETQRTAQTRAVDVTGGWNRRLRPLFSEINKIVNQKTGRSGALVRSHGTPPEVMQFAREKVTTSAGTVYRVELLFNTNAVPPGKRLILESDNPTVIVQPLQELVPDPNHTVFHDVARMVVRICAEQEGQKAIVTATVPGCASASLQVESIAPDVYFPHEGIEWWPDAFQAISGRISHPTLWVDLMRVTDSQVIRVATTSESVEILDEEIIPSSIRVLKEDTAVMKIGKARPRFRADGRQGRCTVEAAWNTLKDALAVEIVDPQNPPPPQGNWTFTGIEFENGPVELDVYPNPEGKICLNVQHPLITSYFGSTSEDAVRSVKADPNLRKLAAHLVVDCILNDLSRKAWRNENGPNANMEIGTRVPSQMAEQVYNYVMMLKGQYGAKWVQGLVGVLGSD